VYVTAGFTSRREGGDFTATARYVVYKFVCFACNFGFVSDQSSTLLCGLNQLHCILRVCIIRCVTAIRLHQKNLRHLQTCNIYSAPVEVRSIVVNPSVCAFFCLCVCVYLSVCLSTSISLESLDQSSRNFVCRCPVAVAHSSSGGVGIRYVLSVLWMTSHLVIIGATPKRGGCAV